MVIRSDILEYVGKGHCAGSNTIMAKFIFSFADGDGKNKQLLGGKGANLCEMTQIGINVPPGFVITTDACLDYLDGDGLPSGLMDEVQEQIVQLEKATGKTFGKGPDPLLVSVRSGSALSMPGMMDTVLNLGLNEETLAGLIKQTGDERFAYDAYRRFIQLFGKVALGIDDEFFDEHFDADPRVAPGLGMLQRGTCIGNGNRHLPRFHGRLPGFQGIIPGHVVAALLEQLECSLVIGTIGTARNR